MSVIKIRQNDTFEDIPTLEGAQGVPGPQGPAGNGVPTGGNENDILIKQSSADYDTVWASLVDKVYPIGIYIETSDSDFNPNTVWGGTWELDLDGTVLVSKSSSSSSKFNNEIGTIIGEEEHTLTVGEMPSHTHKVTTGTAGGVYERILGGVASYRTELEKTGDNGNTGGNQPHNNVQPSKIICRWHRIA